MESRKLNAVDFNCAKDIDCDEVHHWYLKRMTDWRLMPKFEITDAIKSFLTNDPKCVPRFTLIRYSKKLEHIIGRNSFIHPVVLIRQEQVMRSPSSPPKEILEKLETLLVAKKNVFPRLIVETEGMHGFFEGFHLNRYIPGVKIRITEWSGTQRPDIGNEDFPIKAVIYLATPDAEPCVKTRRIRQLLKKSKPTFSGAVIGCSEDSTQNRPKIFLTDSRKGTVKETLEITITFAGKYVESAIHAIDSTSDLQEDLKNIECNLNFPTDDGRVIAFFLDQYWPDPSLDTLPQILKVFPHVNFIRIVVDQILSPADYEKNYLHFIRF